jgi:hydroxymethylglutaryl-CoA lyase
MTDHVELREVGMRDGLQNVGTVLATAAKQAWCAAEVAAGVAEIEVCSYVPAKLIPQFADASEVVGYALTLEGLTVAALVPNLKGAERALADGVHKINYVLSASEAHNQANVRRPLAASVEDFGRIIDVMAARPAGQRPKIAAGIATAFGCTLQGEVSEALVRDLALELAGRGADEIQLADTVGYADPAAVRRLFAAVRGDLGELPLGAHFHDTRGLGIANAVAAFEAGVRRFDASLGGLGGCQFAPGATGNVVMEDMVFLFEAMGVATAIDVDGLLAVREQVVGWLPEARFEGALARAGLPRGFHRVGG